MTQNMKIIEYMRKHDNKITAYEAFKMGCLRLSGRIFDLRTAGYNIWTERKEVVNKDGTKSNIAVYHLREN